MGQDCFRYYTRLFRFFLLKRLLFSQSADDKMIHLEEIKVRETSTSLQNGNAHNNKTPETDIQDESGKDDSCDSSGFLDNFFRCHRFMALLIKNFIRIWRNIGFLLFQFLIPIIQVRKTKSQIHQPITMWTKIKKLGRFDNKTNYFQFLKI